MPFKFQKKSETIRTVSHFFPQSSLHSVYLLDSINSALWQNITFKFLLILNKWNLKPMKTSLGLGFFG